MPVLRKSRKFVSDFLRVLLVSGHVNHAASMTCMLGSLLSRSLRALRNNTLFTRWICWLCLCAMAGSTAIALQFLCVPLLPEATVTVFRNSHYWLLHCCRWNALGRKVLLGLASVLSSPSMTKSTMTRARVRFAFLLLSTAVVRRLDSFGSAASQWQQMASARFDCCIVFNEVFC
jgi:hypothetical protein